MALYTGEAVRVRADVIDPDTDESLVIADGDPDPTATIELWSPTSGDPSRNPGIRDSPDHSGSMTYRQVERDFIVYVHTRGTDITADPGGTPWEPGRWYYRVEVTGQTFTNWEYGNFRLQE